MSLHSNINESSIIIEKNKKSTKKEKENEFTY